MANDKDLSILFVCLGNICRSPTAHAVFRQVANDSSLKVKVESAGTSAYHEGAKPDPRSVSVGNKRGVDFTGIKSRRVFDGDFEEYDYIFAMDKQNLADLMARCPEQYKHKLKLFLTMSEEQTDFDEVPDPYYGGAAGFELVLDLIEKASHGLVKRLLNEVN